MRLRVDAFGGGVLAGMVWKAQRAITLIELLVVLTIMAIVLGLGVAILARTRSELRVSAMVNQLRSMVVFARQSAISQHAPAAIIVDVENNRAVCLVTRTVGMWHMEDDKTTGADGLNGEVSEVVLVKGVLGSALHMGGTGYVKCPPVSPWEGGRGMLLQLWVLVEAEGRQDIVVKEGEFALWVDGDGTLAASVGKCILPASPLKMVPGIWHRVILGCDGQWVYLLVDGRMVTASPVQKELPRPTDSKLYVSSPRYPLYGAVDEVLLCALTEEYEVKLASPARFTSASSPRVCFDSEGRLDRSSQQGPAVIEVQYENMLYRMTINWMGMVGVEAVASSSENGRKE